MTCCFGPGLDRIGCPCALQISAGSFQVLTGRHRTTKKTATKMMMGKRRIPPPKKRGKKKRFRRKPDDKQQGQEATR